MNLIDLYEQYKNVPEGKIGSDDKELIERELKNIDSINSLSDAKMFLSLLAKIREALTTMMGDHFFTAVKNGFSGGDEGIYSGDTNLMNSRFIFELVQNVDDCKYENSSDCKLNLHYEVYTEQEDCASKRNNNDRWY